MMRNIDRRSLRARFSVEVLLWALTKAAPPTQLQICARWGVERSTGYRWAATLAEVHAFAREQLRDSLESAPA